MDENNKTPLCEVVYDISKEEEIISFKEYQKKYSLTSKIIRTALFLAFAVMFGINVYKNPQDLMSIALLGVAFAFAVFVWVQPILVRRNLITALEQIRNDKYKFVLFDDSFSIQTVEFGDMPVEDLTEIVENPVESVENLVNNTDSIVENSVESVENEPLTPDKIKPLIVELNNPSLEFIQNDRVFILLIKKVTYYTVPKRCMDKFTENIISDKLESLKKGK